MKLWSPNENETYCEQYIWPVEHLVPVCFARQEDYFFWNYGHIREPEIHELKESRGAVHREAKPYFKIISQTHALIWNVKCRFWWGDWGEIELNGSSLCLVWTINCRETCNICDLTTLISEKMFWKLGFLKFQSTWCLFLLNWEETSPKLLGWKTTEETSFIILSFSSSKDIKRLLPRCKRGFFLLLFLLQLQCGQVAIYFILIKDRRRH